MKAFGVNNFGEAHAVKMMAKGDQIFMVHAGFEQGLAMGAVHTMNFHGDTKVTGGGDVVVAGGKSERIMEITKTRAKP